MTEQENNTAVKYLNSVSNLQCSCIGSSFYVNDTDKDEHFKVSANNNKHHVTQLTNQDFSFYINIRIYVQTDLYNAINKVMKMS